MDKKVLLISIPEIINNSLIQENVDQKVLSKTLALVQEVYLKPILGDTIYNDFIDAVELKIISGTTLTPVFEGLLQVVKPYLVNRTVAEFIVVNNYKITQKGILKMNDTSANNLSESDLQAVKDLYDNYSTSFKIDLITYLEESGLKPTCSSNEITSDATGWYLGIPTSTVSDVPCEIENTIDYSGITTSPLFYDKKVLIISIPEIIKNSIIQENVDTKILSNTLSMVQEVYLRQILKPNLYNFLIDSIYRNITSGDTLSNGIVNLLQVVKPYLINKTVAEFIYVNQYKITNKGILSMNDTSANNISEGDLQAIKDTYDNISTTYKINLIEFLECNNLVNASSEEIYSDSTGWYLDSTVTCGISNGCVAGNQLDFTGPPGPQGPQGIQGPQGPAGSSGTSGISGLQGPAGTSGTSGISGLAGTNGSSGTSGISGLSGTSGTSGKDGQNGISSSCFPYQGKEPNTSGDPGTAHLLWNNTTQTGATQININVLDETGTDINIFISLITSGQTFVIQDRDVAGNYQIWKVNGTPTKVGTTYWTIPVIIQSSSGVGSTNFTNNHKLILCIVSIGRDGASGTSGTSGISGLAGSNGTSGTSGISGLSGTSGTSGISGLSGTSGTSGISGLSGTSGTSGRDGNPFTGGTISAATRFISGVTANTITVTTISATTYQNLPYFIKNVTRGANPLYLNVTGSDNLTTSYPIIAVQTLTFPSTNVFNVLNTDTTSGTTTVRAITGGTYNQTTGNITFGGTGSINNTITGFTTPASVGPKFNLPIPKIKLIGAGQVDYLDTTGGTGGNFSMKRIPQILTQDLSQELLDNYSVYIEMVHYAKNKKSRRSQGPLTGEYQFKRGGWVVESSWLDGGAGWNVPWPSNYYNRANTKRNAPFTNNVNLTVDRLNWIAVGNSNILYDTRDLFHNKFVECGIDYRDSNGAVQTVNMIVPALNIKNIGINKPNKLYGYSPWVRPFHVAFRYVVWVPGSGGNPGQIISGPLSSPVHIKFTHSPFNLLKQSSIDQQAPCVTIGQQYNDDKSYSCYLEERMLKQVIRYE